jgi:hypothetical protein
MKRILITLLLAAAAVAAVVLWRGWPHLFPSSDTDDLYRRYEHNDYIRATHLKDFQVNDTLATDALLLEAATDSAWCELLLDFGVPEEMIEMYKSNKEFFISNENSSLLLFYMDRNNPSERLPFRHPDSRLVIASFKKQSMSVFLTEDINVKNTIGLSETVKLKNKKQ